MTKKRKTKQRSRTAYAILYDGKLRAFYSPAGVKMFPIYESKLTAEYLACFKTSCTVQKAKVTW